MTRLSTFRNIQEAAQDTIGLDSAGVLALAGSGGSMSVFSTKDSLPMTGLTNGDQALVTGNGRLYVSNGYGWYSTSLINLSPTFDSDINSSFSIVDSQTPLVITNPASDSDDATITYGGIVSDSAQYLVTITRDSSVWTFTPLSADSVGLNATAGLIAESSGGTFTYTFTASDGVNQTQKQVDITYSLSSGPYTGSYGDATYAEIDVSGQAYEVVTFTSSGTLKVFQDITAEYLILGGGGGGARGGGGAGGGAGSSGPNAGVAECQALNQCLGQCGNDEACQQQCLASATPEAQARFQAIITCIQANQCVDQVAGTLDQQCAADNCGAELNACGLGGGGGAMGTGTCEELFTCINRCPMGNQDCINQCIEATSEEGFSQAQAVSQCAQDNEANCPDSSNACLQMQCPDVWNACFGAPATPSGNGTCSGFLDCLQAEQLSRNQCIEATSQESYALFEAITACISANNCQTDECISENCDAEIRACTVDGRQFGVATCNTTLACLNACPNDASGQACAEGCLDAASEAAFFSVQDVFSCASDNMCQAVTAEACAACADDINACNAN